MSEIMPYIWIGIIVFAAVTEIYTFVFVSAWIIPSATASFVLSLTGFQVWIQVSVFFIITLILLGLSRIIFKKFIKFKTAASLTGKNAIVTREINNSKNTGSVRIGGFMLPAKSDDDDIIYESGLIVTIIRLDGSRAVCSR